MLSLRGLAERDYRYRVVDYVSGKDLGTVRRPATSLTVQFDGRLLVEATPE